MYRIGVCTVTNQYVHLHGRRWAELAVSNLLDLREGRQASFVLNLSDRTGGISGVVLTLLDVAISQRSTDEVWAAITRANGGSDGICYVVTTTFGRESWTYIGKTLNTMAGRYPFGPQGGLKRVFDKYAEKGYQAIAVTLYNVSNPALIEGWCYQIAVERAKLPTYVIVNIQDPS